MYVKLLLLIITLILVIAIWVRFITVSSLTSPRYLWGSPGPFSLPCANKVAINRQSPSIIVIVEMNRIRDDNSIVKMFIFPLGINQRRAQNRHRLLCVFCLSAYPTEEESLSCLRTARCVSDRTASDSVMKGTTIHPVVGWMLNYARKRSPNIMEIFWVTIVQSVTQGMICLLVISIQTVIG